MTPADRRPTRPRRAGRDKTEVLEAAIRVIVDRGADATRFQDVASASGVPVSTLQYYFGSREDLLLAAFRHASETEIAALDAKLAASPDPWQRLTGITDATLGDFPAFGDGSGRLWIEAWRFALRDDELRVDVLADYAAWRRLIAAAVRDGIDAGLFTPTESPDRVATLYLSLLDGLGMPLSLGDPAITVDAARDSALSTLAAILGYSGKRAGER
ncbi:TetR/AcrR family transcriptional regulator [Catenulispora subtropica]|uniref:TetR/AcrR family transcriptional regulator n=1 Tax=Catenulispora subtropica TaxID=450798 RepID=A0ABP5CET6_9ACTN